MSDTKKSWSIECAENMSEAEMITMEIVQAK